MNEQQRWTILRNVQCESGSTPHEQYEKLVNEGLIEESFGPAEKAGVVRIETLRPRLTPKGEKELRRLDKLAAEGEFDCDR